MKCLVTGGCGFIGSHVVDALIERGARVVVLDDLSTGTLDNLNSQAYMVQDTILNTVVLGDVVRDADCIFHLAARASVPLSIEDPLGTHEINITGTLKVLEAMRQHGVPRLVYASSSSVYGHQSTHLMQEDMSPEPLSPYGLHKLAGEQYGTMYARLFGITVISLRYFNVYGSRQTAQGSYALVTERFRQQRMAGQPLTIFGDGLQTRAYVHVDDVARATVLAAEAATPRGENTILNIGCAEETSVLEIARMTSEDIEHVYPNPRGNMEERRKMADCSRAQAVLGWEPTIPFDKGFRQFCGTRNSLPRKGQATPPCIPTGK